MNFPVRLRFWALVVLTGLSSWQVHAQPAAAPATSPPATPTLSQALEAAWALSPQARTAASRRAQLQARQQAAGAWLSAEPVLTLAHRTDRLTANGGLREYEAELELPLVNPGVRGATQRELAALQNSFEPQQSLARLQLAGQLRELVAGVAVAQAEQTVAQRKLLESQTLARDVERRVKAGDAARVDSLQAQAAAQQAAGALATAQGSLARLQAQWQSLTGLAGVSAMEPAAAPTPNPGLADHPALLAAQSLVQAAQAKLALTEADRRDPMSLSFGATRERAAFGASGETTLRLALKIPLGSDNRNAPRLAAARAELDEAQAQADAVARQTQGEIAAATAELASARRAVEQAAQRTALSRQAQALLAKAFALGQLDLPSRLRADNEAFDAELGEARAAVEVQRALSKLNQALGLMP